MNSRWQTADDFPQSTIDTVVRAFVVGMHGYKMTTGHPLTATDALSAEHAMSEARLPLLALHNWQSSGPIESTERDELSLLVNALFKVQASKAAAGPSSARAAVVDLYRAVDVIRGLPVDRDSNVYALSHETAGMFDRGEVRQLVHSGPEIVSCRVQELPGTPFALCLLQFRLGFYQDHTLDPAGVVRKVVVNARCVSPFHVNVPTLYSAASPAGTWSEGETSQGVTQYTTEPPAIEPAATPGEPPFSGGSNDWGTGDGDDPAVAVARINVTPYTVAVAALGTSQLQALVYFGDGRVSVETSVVTWATTDAGVATVSATGLVTGVAAGSCSITATLYGATSNAVAVTVS